MRFSEVEDPRVVLDRLYRLKRGLVFRADEKDRNLDAKTGESYESFRQRLEALARAIRRERTRMGVV